MLDLWPAGVPLKLAHPYSSRMYTDTDADTDTDTDMHITDITDTDQTQIRYAFWGGFLKMHSCPRCLRSPRSPSSA